MEIIEGSLDRNHIDRMSSNDNNRSLLNEQMLTMDTQNIASRTDSLHARAEKAIEKLQGHVKLSQSPELSGLIGNLQPDQTLVCTPTIVEVIDILQESLINFSTLELDAAQDSFAAEESHLLNERVREMTRQMYQLIEIIGSLSPVPITEVEAIERDLRQAGHSKVIV